MAELIEILNLGEKTKYRVIKKKRFNVFYRRKIVSLIEGKKITLDMGPIFAIYKMSRSLPTFLASIPVA